MPERLKLMCKAARTAGGFLKENQHSWIKFKKKQDGSFVGNDEYAEQIIRNILADSPCFEECSFIGEEIGGTAADGKEHVWIDPLDGTTNYKLRIPYYCVSIGIEKERESIEGVIHYPDNEGIFFASKGKGSYYKTNNQIKKLELSACSSLENSIILVEKSRTKPKFNEFQAFLSILENNASKIRQMGSTALDACLIAQGLADIAIIANCAYAHDIAAAEIIVKEAGGSCFDIYGNPLFHQLYKNDFKEPITGAVFCSKSVEAELKEFIRKNYN